MSLSLLALLLPALLGLRQAPRSVPVVSSPPSNAEAAQFERAVRNDSTAPSLVVITVRGSSGARGDTYCTGANFLLGALHIEYALDYDEPGQEKAVRLALAGRESGFVLHKRKARANVARFYTAEDLRWAQEVLAPYSNREVVARFSVLANPSFEETLYASRVSRRGHLRFALGHVLYLRGLDVGTGCLTSELWVSQPDTP